MQAIDYLQQRFGSADYADWQSLRKQWYSYQPYNSTSGNSQIVFFGTTEGATNLQRTNLTKAGSFGQNHFLMKSLRCDFFIADMGINNWSGTDATAFYAELVAGIFQAGVLTMTIGQRPFIQLPLPFLYAPPGHGNDQIHSAGIDALTLAEGTPNTLSTSRSSVPYATLANRHASCYLVDPAILIEAEQNFEVRLDFPSGALAGVATDIIDDSTNPLYLGVSLDGINFRPLQ